MRYETAKEIVARNIAQNLPAAKLIAKGEWAGILKDVRFTKKRAR